MSESKHTPGPWKYKHGLTYFTKRGQLVKTELVTGVNGEWVAAVILDHEAGLPTKVQESNARLIAAAPELLEALEHLIETLDNISSSSVECWTPDAERARAAITKAKGLPK